MSFCFLYNVVSENHSVQNSPWGGGGSIASSRSSELKKSFVSAVTCSALEKAKFCLWKVRYGLHMSFGFAKLYNLFDISGICLKGP